MTALTKDQFGLPQTRITEAVRMSLCLTVSVMGLFLTMMLLLTGCGGGEETPANGGATASLSWDPVHDPSVIAYFVHYGRQSPGQPGSCAYESSMHASVPSATVTNLEPNTVYYFAVSAYNGIESVCSSEVSTLTSSV
jgi:hypothetical protein